MLDKDRLQNLRKYITQPRRAVLLGILGIVLLWLAWMGFHAIQLTLVVQEAQTAMQSADGLGLAQSGALARRAVDAGQALDTGLTPLKPLTWLLDPLPGLAGQVAPLLDLAGVGLRSGDALLDAFDPLWSAENASLPLPQRVLLAAQQGEADIDRATASLAELHRPLQAIEPAALPEPAAGLITRLKTELPLITGAAGLLNDLPALLGGDGETVYLLMAQNNDELRATGGFITGLGTLRFVDGHLADFELGDSYAIDDFSLEYPSAPEPLERLMLAGVWVARDANWSPDFPQSARDVQALYSLSTGQEVDAVLAFDQQAVAELVSAFGPFELPDAAQPVNAQTIETYMQQAWAPDGGEGLSETWWLGRKSFMAELGGVMLEHILDGGKPSDLARLAQTGLDLLERGHLRLYFMQPDIQADWSATGMDGALAPASGDYLWLIDSNVGFNKMDAVIQRSLAYSVDLRLEQPAVDLEIHYTNPVTADVACVHEATYGDGTYADMQRRCYWNYWRVYTPHGTQLTGERVAPVSGEVLLSGLGWPGPVEQVAGEAGSQVFAGVLVIPPGETHSVALRYTLPQGVLTQAEDGAWEYRLQVMKQPGLDSLPVEISVQLPPGITVLESPLVGEMDEHSLWRWQASLQSPQTLVWRWRAGLP